MSSSQAKNMNEKRIKATDFPLSNKLCHITTTLINFHQRSAQQHNQQPSKYCQILVFAINYTCFAPKRN